MQDQLCRNDIADFGRNALQRPERQRHTHRKERAGRCRLRQIVDEPLERRRLVEVQRGGKKSGSGRQNEGMQQRPS